VVEAFLATGNGKRGPVGAAPSILVRAKEIVPFAVRWLEAKLPRP
jgi:aminoglycoside 3-N-acetyltransferase